MKQEVSLCELQPKGHCLTSMRQPSGNFKLPDSYNTESLFGNHRQQLLSYVTLTLLLRRWSCF